MKKEQEQYQSKGKCYFECIFVDGKKEDFGCECTYIKEYGKNGDMLSFYSEQYNSTIMQIIPKNQIRQIIRRNPVSVWEEENGLE